MLTTPPTPKLNALPHEGSALSSGKGHSPYPRNFSRTLSSTIFYQLNAYEPNALYSLASALTLALTSASASASAAVARCDCGSFRLAACGGGERRAGFVEAWTAEARAEEEWAGAARAAAEERRRQAAASRIVVVVVASPSL